MGVELKLEGFKHLSTVQKMLDLHEYMVAYFCNHLSDNFVNLSEKNTTNSIKSCFYSELLSRTAIYLSV